MKSLTLNQSLALLTTLLLSAAPLGAANIAWLSFHAGDNQPSSSAATAGFLQAPDVGYTALLAANGHTVTRFVSVENLDTNPGLIAAMNTNDLIIISRSASSGNFELANETAAWNGLLKPVMVLNGYVTRLSRLGYTTGSGVQDISANEVRLRAAYPAHPIYDGVSFDSNNVMVNGYAQRVSFNSILQNGISVNTDGAISGGTVWGVVGSGSVAVNSIILAEYPAGLTASHGRDVLASKRYTVLTGSRENSITGNGAGIYDLLPDGEKIFLNAVNYATAPVAPRCLTTLGSATNLVAGDMWTFNPYLIGDAPLSYQWYKDGAPLADETGATLVFTNLAASDAGEYQLVVTNYLGSYTSSVGRLEFAVFASASITNGLVSYWPLDTVFGSKTPDVVSTFDMTLLNLSEANLVEGKWGSGFLLNGSNSCLTRTHNPGEELPIYQHPNFSVSLWVNGFFDPNLNRDRRVFSETSLSDNDPMLAIGTHNDMAGDSGVDIYIRNDTGGTSGDHRHSTAQVFDGFWHNVVYVQRDIGGGNMKAQVFVDGALDPVQVTPVRPLTPTVTSIGGLVRASVSGLFAGTVDEVAVWERALSAEEVGILQVTSITNPPARPQPLVISQFKADLPAVTSGGTTRLRWEMNRDVTQVTIAPIGDVTAETSFGTGSRAVTLNQTTTYVLTAQRGADTLSATTMVTVVNGVAPGWVLLDNFDQAKPGSLYANGHWNDASGNSVQVVTANGNRAVRTSTGNSVSYLNLRDLTLTEGQAATLFFRLIAGADNASGITHIVGLTDKPQRDYGDAVVNIGPVLYVTAFTNDLIFATTNAWYTGVRNGYFGNNTSPDVEYPGPALEAGAVYNVWIDVTNGPWGEYINDRFSVHIQKIGDPGRTTLFSDYMSDRDPFYVDTVLGGMLPNLDKLVLLGNSGTHSAVFDDFYLSTGGYNATVPRAYEYTGALPGPVSLNWAGNQLEIRWTNGVLQQATSVTGPWTDVAGNPASPYLVTPSGTGVFYRSRL